MNPLTEIQIQSSLRPGGSHARRAGHRRTAGRRQQARGGRRHRSESAEGDRHHDRAAGLRFERGAAHRKRRDHAGLRAAHNAVQPKASAFYSSIPLNEGLWKAIRRTRAPKKGARSKGPITASSPRPSTHSSATARTRRGGQSPAEGNRRRAGRGHHEIFGKRSGCHECLGAGDHRRSPAEGLAAVRGGDGPRGSRIEGRRRMALHVAGSQLRRGDDVSGRWRRCANRSGTPTTRERLPGSTTTAP